MKRHLLMLAALFILLNASALSGQNSESKEVLKVIEQLFDGMRKGDSAMVSVLFHKEARMFTSYRNPEGTPVLKEGSLYDFLKAIAAPHPEVWDEKIWDTEVRIDGDLAQVWTDYAFYVGENFSHCGIDAFQLAKGPGGKWRIVNLMDTRRKEPCSVP